MIHIHFFKTNSHFLIAHLVPILACGGDDSKVHLFVQISGQVCTTFGSFWSVRTQSFQAWELYSSLLEKVVLDTVQRTQARIKSDMLPKTRK